MNHPILISVLLALAVLVIYACCLGLLRMGSAPARLHYLGPASMLAPPLVAAAVLAQEGLSQAGLKALLIVFLLILQGPILAHILGRAITFHDRGYPSKEPGQRR